MEELRSVLRDCIDETLIQIVLSAAKKKDSPAKVKVRPVRIKGELKYQESVWDGKKEYHYNYDSCLLYTSKSAL